MPAPVAETPPHGLNAYWLGCWKHALKVMKAQGTWAWELKPLLDEYIWALVEAEQARGIESPVAWDRATKRAAALADQLVLTARSRKALGVTNEDDKPEDPFGALDEADELARRRSA